MRYRLHLSTFDVMDRVEVTARMYDDASEDRELVLERSITFKGTGEDDPEDWARDALVALLEVI